MKLRARRALAYATRRLQPGDVFEAKNKRDHRILLASRKVEAMRDPVDLPAPPPPLAATIEAAVAPDDIAAARAEYEAAVGRKPFHGWDVDALREKIAAAKAGQ